MLNDNLKSNGTIPRTVRVKSLRQIEESYDFRYDPGAVLVTLIALLLATLAILATAIDIGLIECLRRQRGSLPVNVQSKEAQNFIYGDSAKYDRDMVKVFVELKKDRAKDTLALNREASKKTREILARYKEASQISKDPNMELTRQMKPNETTPTVTLDVMALERQITSCKRCGKYRKHCVAKRQDNLPVPCPIQYKTCAALTNTEYRKRDNVYLNLLLSFSLKHNWKRIFNTTMANKDLAVVHSLRILATFWVIFIHVVVLVDYLSGKSCHFDSFK